MLKTIMLILSVLPSQSIDIPKIAVESCKNVRASRATEALEVARKMYEVELEFELPSYFRGMTLAAACLESGFNPRVRGDANEAGKHRAVGVLQLWPWWEKYYKTDRTDPVSSTRSWMQHIMKQVPKVKSRCRTRNEKKLMIQAWVHAIRAPKPGGRCQEKPLHLRQLRKIKKIIKRSSVRGNHMDADHVIP